MYDYRGRVFLLKLLHHNKILKLNYQFLRGKMNKWFYNNYFKNI